MLQRRKATFEKLLEPGRIGRVQTRNRIIKPGSGMAYADKDGHVTDAHKVFYEALARGGVGLIIVEASDWDLPLTVGFHGGGLRLDSDKCIPGLSELVEIIHKHGCPAFMQFLHGGPWHDPNIGGPPIAASFLNKSELPPTESGLPEYVSPRGLETGEIEELVNKFAIAVERSAKAGFDGVEINGAGAHLINTFFSRVWNKRQDKYGCQSLENRARFMVEIVQAIKKRLGQDFPVSTLINGAEYGVDKGTTIEEAKGFAQLLQAAGADAIHVRGYGYGQHSLKQWPEQVFYPAPPTPLPGPRLDWSRKGRGAFIPLAAAIKEVVSIPVMGVGRLDPVLGEQLLREGKVDFIGMTRRLLADQELPNKVAAGRLKDIAPCTACLSCFGSVGIDGHGVVCRVNAALGGVKDYAIKPAERKKKVVIIGGGPAGMEASRVAATRGHEVTLFEREPKLGGLVPLAAVVKGFEIEDLATLIRYLKTQITKLGVHIRLGKEFEPSVITEIRPDVVILAAGGILTVPGIPGIHRSSVVSGYDLHRRLKTYLRLFSPKFLRWLTRIWMPLGKEVVIIGGGVQGCQMAEFLVKRGRRVTIVDTGTAETLGKGLPWIKLLALRTWLVDKGVTMITEVKYEEITGKGLVVTTKEGKRQTIEADTIVTAMPLSPNTGLLKALEGKVPEVYAIGDCSEPGLIIDAIADGYRIASNV